jgi:hypothetical protein
LSEGDDNCESKEDEQTAIIKQKPNVNKGWPSMCHYTPGSDSHLIKLRSQPSELRSIIRAAINMITGDAMHETPYRSTDSLVSYNRHILWKSARFLNFSLYAKRFVQDHEFGKVIGRTVRAVSCYASARTLTIVPSF